MKQKQRIEIINEIKYQLAKGEHTFSMCPCGRNSCRGEKCWECWLEMLK